MIGQSVSLKAATLERDGHRMVFDADIAPGKIAALIGPSGAGKTTLLNLIAGFERIEEGAIRIGEADMSKTDPADRPVSMVFQENNLFSHLDIATNVLLGIRPRLSADTGDLATVSAALERVGLTGFERRMPGTLSGGERQRVAIARALVRRRPVLLLDEPFAALGPRLRRDMLLLVKQLQIETGMTVLIVTHQPQEAADIADEIIFLDAGKSVAAGPAEGFFKRKDIPGLSDYLGHGE
ncbi:ATP-binding cassette domain-containing protein [Hoeflea prorocentri]|uniref:ATP-binding cassette domain-containing protein n=1 Tax=Hoeflea prorocentri TaxID=1922333 RepID=A0A9X3UQW0_9HYPH|nr:ATP-binding cassette domain-containing protein [Hoeflea prorocentri]MCY6383556.1 ATP-binding cassette domain-containing protein [Hoeflea prorocentri]MDA5401356.1 ATP-binding cassette domain-containing protein [Hoeflea prorocentri]